MAKKLKKLPPEVVDWFREQGMKGASKGGLLGGAKGGKRSLETMTPEARKARAQKAAAARWAKKGKQ